MITKIGIRREDKNRWERRVPLVPSDVEKLIRIGGVEIFLQPSTIRIFSDEEYKKVGAILQEDLSKCDLILAVKEIPESLFKPGVAYMFFSHTIKGQPQNMAMLRRLKELGCSLIDYERIVDEKSRRLVFFGYYAGLAGMINSLWALGRRLEWEGFKTPFLSVRCAHEYSNLVEAKEAIKSVGKRISNEWFPATLQPMVFGFAGYGNVSKGAQEIFDLLPHSQIDPNKLTQDLKNRPYSNEIIKVIFKEEHTVKPRTAGAQFQINEFFSFPERYETAFRPYADFLTVLINCIYWSTKSPRLLTKKDAKELWGGRSKPQLKVIGDISCDIEGGLEFCLKATQPDNPVYVYNFNDDSFSYGVEGNGPVVMAVDNLPCELSSESSQEFSTALLPLLQDFIKTELNENFSKNQLSGPLKRGVLLWKGDFTPEYEFMKDFIKQ